MKRTRIYLEWRDAPVRRFRAGVSLHSHTLHSRETLGFVYRLAKQVAPIRWAVAQGESQYRVRHGGRLDLRRAWWTPPCAPHDAWLLEARQIEHRLQLRAMVSLTDHDSVEAPLSLHALDSCRDVPVSFEWTVPFGSTFFHLGVHNLPVATAQQIFRELQDLVAALPAAGQHGPDLIAALDSLSQNPGTLVVFNHPCWDESGIGAEKHAALASEFLRRYGRFLHALELNGLRPWKENRLVLQMAQSFGKPAVSGGDRHALEANSMLDLTGEATFSEYVDQVRSGFTNVLVAQQYRQPLGLRILRSLEEILQDHRDHGCGWRSWSDRVFYHCNDGVVRSVTELFPRGLPRPIRLFVNGVGIIRHCGMQRLFRLLLHPQQECAL